jgi:hypothetical protein
MPEAPVETGRGDEVSSIDRHPSGISKEEAKRHKKAVKSLSKQRKKEGT